MKMYWILFALAAHQISVARMTKNNGFKYNEKFQPADENLGYWPIAEAQIVLGDENIVFGSIVSKRHVLLAAGPILGLEPQVLTSTTYCDSVISKIIVGSDKTSVDVAGATMKCHENFNKENPMINNIAILKLANNLLSITTHLIRLVDPDRSILQFAVTASNLPSLLSEMTDDLIPHNKFNSETTSQCNLTGDLSFLRCGKYENYEIQVGHELSALVGRAVTTVPYTDFPKQLIGLQILVNVEKKRLYYSPLSQYCNWLKNNIENFKC